MNTRQKEGKVLSLHMEKVRKYALKGILPFPIAISLMCASGMNVHAETGEGIKNIHLHQESPEEIDVSCSSHYQPGEKMYSPTVFRGEQGMFIYPRIASPSPHGNGVKITEFFLSDDNKLFKIESVKNPHMVTTSEYVFVNKSVSSILKDKDSSLGADTVFDQYEKYRHNES